MHVRKLSVIGTLALTAALTGLGCSEGSSDSAASASERPEWLLTSAPEGGLSVTDAKTTAKEGDEIVVRGIIGGQVEVLSADSPVFRIVDTGLYNKCTSGDDHCPTPWDYCCAPKDELVANSATVQVVSASGAKIDLVAGGLLGLDEILIVGTVEPRPSDDVLTIRATGVYRQN